MWCPALPQTLANHLVHTKPTQPDFCLEEDQGKELDQLHKLEQQTYCRRCSYNPKKSYPGTMLT